MHAETAESRKLSADAALQIDEIIQRREDRQLDDQHGRAEPDEERDRGLLHDLKQETGLALTFDDIDLILEKCLDIARRRYPR